MKGKLISLLVLLAVILGCQTNDVPDNKHESISIQMISEEVTLLEDGKGSIRFKVIPAEQSESVVSEYEDILHICLSDGDKDNRDMPILSCELTSDNVIETVFLITGQFPDDFYSEYICFVVIEFEDEWIVSDSIKITYQPKEDDFSEVPMYIKYSTYDGKPVDLYTSEGFGAVLISNAYDEESGIGYLNFDKHVTHVPDYAFMACTNLTSVELPESVSEIGVKAFMGCSSMQETIIPESVKKIGALAFEDCSGKLTIGCDIPSCSTDCAEAPFAKADFDEVEILEGVEKLGSGAFYECTSLERITLPNSLNNISYKAFYGCVSLVEISIPDSVVEIWKNVFENCISLETVHLPSSIDYIRDYIFKGCKRLTNIEIPSNVAAIGTGAFENCVALKKIVIPNKVFDIHDNAFCGCSSLEEIELGVRVQTIGLDAFNGCSSTKEVVVPRNVKSIGSHAFCGCTGKLVVECNIPDAIEPAGAFAYSCFETIEVADFVENVGDSAFYSCEYVTNVQLPDGLLYLGASAFAGCKRLKAIKIPRMISEIKQNVFKGCNSLESLELHDDILKIGASSFWGCGKLEEIIIPSKVEEIGNCAFAICGNLKITIPESVRFLGNQVFLDTKGELIFNCEIPDCYTDKDSPFYGSLFESVAIGDNVTRIADHLFYRSEELKSVKFGARVKSVGQCAFYQCSELEDIYFNDGLIEICRSAFAGCRALQMVSIPPTLEKLGAVAFYECSELSEVYMYPVTPPEAVYSSNSWGSFHSIKGSIYVPVGSESLYKSTEGWSFYKSKIFGKL